MPYINNKKGERGLVLNGDIKNAGELNYYISSLIGQYVLDHGLCYKTLNQVTGALNDIKTEFERRIVAPYEDKKINENGDVETYVELLELLKEMK